MPKINNCWDISSTTAISSNDYDSLITKAINKSNPITHVIAEENFKYSLIDTLGRSHHFSDDAIRQIDNDPRLAYFVISFNDGRSSSFDKSISMNAKFYKQISLKCIKADSVKFPKIKNVEFNDPLTIVIWDDNTKTIVKAEKEDYDPEKGMAMAIAKKALGNKYNSFNSEYDNAIRKYIKRRSKDNKGGKK